MDFDTYQKLAGETAVYPNRGSNLIYPALGLAGEAGEVCEKVKKMIRDDGGTLTVERREALAREIGDVLWYCAALCHELAVSMDGIAAMNLNKLAKRKAAGTLHGSGDQR